MMEQRFIDANALKDDLRESYNALKKIYDRLEHNDDRAICGGQIATFLEAILRVKEAPTIEADPVKHGRWERFEDDENWSVCSECRCCWEREKIEAYNISYCPNCGAKMDLEVTNGLDQH